MLEVVAIVAFLATDWRMSPNPMSSPMVSVIRRRHPPDMHMVCVLSSLVPALRLQLLQQLEHSLEASLPTPAAFLPEAEPPRMHSVHALRTSATKRSRRPMPLGASDSYVQGYGSVGDGLCRCQTIEL
jgi:hypothetical protein